MCTSDRACRGRCLLYQQALMHETSDTPNARACHDESQWLELQPKERHMQADGQQSSIGHNTTALPVFSSS